MTSRHQQKNVTLLRLFSFTSFLFFVVFFLHFNFDGLFRSAMSSGRWMDAWAAGSNGINVSSFDEGAGWLGDAAAWLMQPLIYVANLLLWVFLGFTSLLLVLAVTIFGWSVDPAMSHNMLNMASVYTMWRMIRDFFNLFFILTILFIAFSTIFQVSAYNYKKLLWHLVLMALLVNFSFPVTRFIIDATNVPMYFFMESAFRDQTTAKPTQLFGTVFSSSNLRQLLIPNASEINGKFNMTLRLITNLVFMFLFSVSLLVLAVLFLIRLIMLTVLIIFSPIGFAGTAIPGFDKYAKQWWDSLMKYALFGPSAMLILLISIVFLKEFKMDQSPSQAALKGVAGDVTSSAANKDIAAAMATSIVPIVLIWTAISIGQKMGIEGAAGITSFAQKTSKGLGRKFSGADSIQRNWKEYKKEREGRSSAKFAANNWGAKLGKNLNSKLDEVSASRTGNFDWKDPSTYRNVTSLETAKARQARLRYLNHDLEAVNKAAKDNLLEQKSDDQIQIDHDNAVKKQDYKMVAATAGVMGARNMKVEQEALDMVREKYGKVGGIDSLVTKDVEKKLITSDPGRVLTTRDAAGNEVFDETKFKEMLNKGQIDRDKIAAHGWTENVTRFMNEEKKLDAKFLNDLSKKNPAAVAQIARSIDAEITRMNAVTGLTPTQQAAHDKALTSLHVAHVNRTGDFHASATASQRAAVFKKADADVLKNMGSAVLAVNAAVIAENMNAQQFGTTISKLAQDGTDVTDLLTNIGRQGIGPNADKVRNALTRDNRLNTL